MHDPNISVNDQWLNIDAACNTPHCHPAQFAELYTKVL